MRRILDVEKRRKESRNGANSKENKMQFLRNCQLFDKVIDAYKCSPCRRKTNRNCRKIVPHSNAYFYPMIEVLYLLYSIYSASVNANPD